MTIYRKLWRCADYTVFVVTVSVSALSEALELISTAANHSNAAIRKMVSRLSDLSKGRSALPNQTVADAVATVNRVAASLGGRAKAPN